MTPTLPPAWQALLKDELQKPYWCSLEQRLGAAYESGAVYPPAQQLFAAFERTPPTCVRAVILGQDPYHEPGQANGLAFSVSRGVKLPPSLQNIYKELEADLGVPAAKSGDLTSWAQQGVFLLNTVLSVRAHAANSHKDFGWQSFTDAVIAALAELRSLGRAGAEEGGAGGKKPVSAAGAAEPAPEPFERVPRFFRQPPVFADQRISGFVWFFAG